MISEVKWGIALLVSTCIGYVPVVSKFTSNYLIFGIPSFSLLLGLQTVIVLALLIGMSVHGTKHNDEGATDA